MDSNLRLAWTKIVTSEDYGDHMAARHFFFEWCFRIGSRSSQPRIDHARI
jgi:hypothetical protein